MAPSIRVRGLSGVPTVFLIGRVVKLVGLSKLSSAIAPGLSPVNLVGATWWHDVLSSLLLLIVPRKVTGTPPFLCLDSGIF